MDALIDLLGECNAKMDGLLKDNARMRETLLWLDRGGGLGHDVHERINAALGVQYPKFCRHPEKCAGKGRCMSDYVCND